MLKTWRNNVEWTGGKGKMLYTRVTSSNFKWKKPIFPSVSQHFCSWLSKSSGYPWFNNHGTISIKGKVSCRWTKANQYTHQKGTVVHGTFSLFGTISIDEMGYTILGILVLIRGEPDQPLNFEGRVCSISQFWLTNRISHRTFWLISWTIY